MTTTDASAAQALRQIFGAFPSGVAAVCAVHDGTPVGMAVSTFNPVSIDPPLVSLCIQNTSATWVRLRQATRLGVSILGEGHEHACRQLARKEGDRFEGVQTLTTPSGSIQVQDACAWFECSLEAEFPAGDHVIALLRIQDKASSSANPPLVFHGSKFRRLADIAD